MNDVFTIIILAGGLGGGVGLSLYNHIQRSRWNSRARAARLERDAARSSQQGEESGIGNRESGAGI
jgi:hypothetical protein